MGAARAKMWRTTCKGQDQEAPEILQRASTFGTSSLCRASNSSTHAGWGRLERPLFWALDSRLGLGAGPCILESERRKKACVDATQNPSLYASRMTIFYPQATIAKDYKYLYSEITTRD